MITPYMKFNQNLRGRVLFQDFFGRSVVERPIGEAIIFNLKYIIHECGLPTNYL